MWGSLGIEAFQFLNNTKDFGLIVPISMSCETPKGLPRPTKKALIKIPNLELHISQFI